MHVYPNNFTSWRSLKKLLSSLRVCLPPLPLSLPLSLSRCWARTELNVRQLARPTVQNIYGLFFFSFLGNCNGRKWPRRLWLHSRLGFELLRLHLHRHLAVSSFKAAGKLHKSAAPVLGLGSGAALIDILVYRPPC